jgi:hypothetical protein
MDKLVKIPDRNYKNSNSFEQHPSPWIQIQRGLRQGAPVPYSLFLWWIFFIKLFSHFLVKENQNTYWFWIKLV